MTNKTNPIPPIFFHLAAALVLASGGQGDSFRKKPLAGATYYSPGPVKHLQKLLFITAKREKQVLSLLARPDHVKYNLVKEKETK